MHHDTHIVMRVRDLRLLLDLVRKYKHYQTFSSDHNRDGQGEWHFDIALSDKPLGDDSWGDGEENFSFDNLANHINKFGISDEDKC